MRAKPVVPPAIDDDQPSTVNRRQFLKLMGASLALAGLGGCSLRPPDEQIVPYALQPEEVVPARPLYFATAAGIGGYALGLLVESQTGRPIKVEGNPKHPASLGATDILAQASVLTLWDPDRAGGVLQKGQGSTWEQFLSALGQALQQEQGSGGAGLRVLTETVTSPTLAAQLKSLMAKFPSARWHQYEPAGSDNSRAGAQMAFGQPVGIHYRFDLANVVVSLDGDFLGSGPTSVRYGHDFATRRRAYETTAGISRLYVAEPVPTITGASADHRLPLRPGLIEGLARALAQALGVQVPAAAGGTSPSDAAAAWLSAAAADLKAAGGSSIILAGESQPPIVHALAHAMNSALGNTGKTVIVTDPVEANPTDQGASLRTLVQEMGSGAVKLLAILGGNPVYTAPADLDFAGALAKVPFSVHLGLYADETGAASTWHVPEAHYMEAWSDLRAFDGTASIVQPLIAPLFGAKSAHELLSALLGQAGQAGYDAVRATWQGQAGGSDFETTWQAALQDGIIGKTQAPAAAAGQTAMQGSLAGQATPAPGAQQALELVFRPDPNIWDGRYANNAWLQELPKPISKITWDNVAMISPATAQRLGLSDGQLVDLTYQGRTVRAPLSVMSGHADDAVTVTLGYGRTRAGSVGNKVGFNAYAIRTSGAPWFGPGLEIKKAGGRYLLAVTQHEYSMQDRPLVKVATLQEFQANPTFARGEGGAAGATEPTQSLYPGFSYPGYAWAMAIDLSVCTGCQACVVACQAENNIATVGKEQVARNRAMHWIRVDSYYVGDQANPAFYFQPRPCMHCEQAPCEFVCPVHATVHSSDGLNDMVYNRCVGTRYCSNNCPYKVRRFNFFEWSDFKTLSLKQRWNPEVTVRSRGVMEKCTFCVQRIRSAEIQAANEGRRIQDGEVMAACQQACPTGAIVFGDLNDPSSRVLKLKKLPLEYALLGNLNTRPRTTYLAVVRNPNPAIKGITP